MLPGIVLTGVALLRPRDVGTHSHDNPRSDLLMPWQTRVMLKCTVFGQEVIGRVVSSVTLVAEIEPCPLAGW
jgi:hypothetical protein